MVHGPHDRLKHFSGNLGFTTALMDPQFGSESLALQDLLTIEVPEPVFQWV
jgi:hypothetical protein